ncbi:LysR family transcriptional regulator [Propionibacterium australiense]|uniref:LysR family transcriptional regulator n=1 Tax=Propionibacterium australiense TaxID=119981 RepID=A0A383S904_9ACTN|nr:LysR family transcriptional regulator [Propionibacterium australiense]RLP06337.1 LysR family transcriptional regulator [Propionibacterium australiense]RLP10740.1 LysR family transcriptional regulator [Propionibacterium australiense]SYZ34505.1 Transcription regulator HTH, LysR [Propionibacterium australiense]VEH89830.1 Morphology and auto-aggregation control protein [Propionibacterium australiense]
MEIRTLRSFLAIAREGSMTRAAEQLHLTQPTLSKQMKTLERELGQRLFVRHSSSVGLTDEGRLLRDRADDLVRMADRIEREFSALDDVTGGDLHLGLAESHQVSLIAREIRRLKRACPGLRYHITSGDTEQVTEKLDRGVLDFAALVEEPDDEKYGHLTFPGADVWGVVVRDDHELASRSAVTLDDLVGVPLFCSEQSWRRDIPLWAAERMPQLHLEGTFRLAYNGAVFVREGLGCLLTFDRLVGTGEGTGLVFRPLAPALTTTMHLIWRRHQVFSPIAERFLAQLRSSLTAAEQ